MDTIANNNTDTETAATALAALSWKGRADLRDYAEQGEPVLSLLSEWWSGVGQTATLAGGSAIVLPAAAVREGWELWEVGGDVWAVGPDGEIVDGTGCPDYPLEVESRPPDWVPKTEEEARSLVLGWEEEGS